MNPANEPRKESIWSTIIEWVRVIVVALAIAIPVRYFIAQPFIVNGASMDPTFSTGQFLVVDRLSYRFVEPARGDVIVFAYPLNPKTYYIKRIIGLPGEEVIIQDGVVNIINSSHPEGIKLEESYITSGHISRDNLKFKLKEGEYFVMGDNRIQSSDSRVWGALKEDLITGRPIIRLLPPTAITLWPGEHKYSE